MTDKVNQVIDGLNHSQRGESVQDETNLIRDLQNEGPTSFAFHRQQINDGVNFAAMGLGEDFLLHSVTADNRIVSLNQAGDRWQLRSGTTLEVQHEMPVGKNPLNTGDAAGTYVRRPDGAVDYTVKAGDTLWNITKDVMTKTNNGRVPADVDIDQNYRKIAQANALADPNRLSIGQRLTIPPVGPDGILPVSQQAHQAFQPTYPGFDAFPQPTSDIYPVSKAGQLTTMSPGLMPQGRGVFSPLAPMGMMGSDPSYIYDTDKVGVDHMGGATRTSYTGWLRDSTLGLNDNNTKFDYADVTDASGRLLSRHIEYSNPKEGYKDTGAEIKFDRGFGSPISLGVRSVDIKLDSSGHYQSVIRTDDGRTYQSTVDSTGRVLRFFKR
jgi:hypothetical protein